MSLLLSIAGVTFSANDDDGNTIVDRNVRMVRSVLFFLFLIYEESSFGYDV